MLTDIGGFQGRSIYGQIFDERLRQDKLWGEQNHSVFVWLSILGEEFGEVAEAINDTLLVTTDSPKYKNAAHIREELVQLAAVAVAMIECGDRNGWDTIK